MATLIYLDFLGILQYLSVTDSSIREPIMIAGKGDKSVLVDDAIMNLIRGWDRVVNFIKESRLELKGLNRNNLGFSLWAMSQNFSGPVKCLFV